MKTRLLWALSLLIVASLILGACGSASQETTVEEPPRAEVDAPSVEESAPVEIEAPPEVEEPAPAEPVTITDADLDAAFTTFLGDMSAYNTIGLEGLNEMMIDEAPFLLDVRGVSEVEDNGYIDGAVVIPLRELGASLESLPSFDTTIVSYCGSGWRCTIALTALEGMGWENVLGLKGGSFTGWVEAGYPVAEGVPELVALEAAEVSPVFEAHFEQTVSTIPEGWGVITADQLNQEIIENPDLVVIDTRRAEELEEKGQIEGAIHIPLESFVEQQDLWPADMDAPIVVYCGSGHRSTIAMTMLWSYGYENVRSLKGGFNGWVEAGYPVVEAAL